MMTVEDMLKEKGPSVRTIHAEATALDAARRMNEHRIGSLVVMDQDAVVGIVTERDILTRLVATEAAPSHTLVSEIMTERVIVCGPNTRLDELRSVMRDKRIRHVPVLDRGRLIGLVSIGDLNLAREASLSQTVSYLEAYIRQG
ncbi:MAG: CBS domain-containing protein [Phycisphaeraceae bacterium]|nr:CBS domain-containing protein [Phycisphaeraceae bacterium]